VTDRLWWFGRVTRRVGSEAVKVVTGMRVAGNRGNGTPRGVRGYKEIQIDTQRVRVRERTARDRDEDDGGRPRIFENGWAKERNNYETSIALQTRLKHLPA